MWILCGICLVVSFSVSAYGQSDVRKPPTITKHPSARVIYRNDDSVTLECKAEGIPDVSYEWKRNGRELNQNQPNINKGPDGTITIQDATSVNEGFYQCFAMNQYGTAVSTTAHIQRAILDSASGTPTTLRKTVQEGMPFHIQADPRKSFPKPTYGWEMATDTVDKNPIPLRASRRVQIAENGNLHFAYALPEDALDGRIYRCTTYNPHLDVKAGGSYTKLTVARNPAGITPFSPTLGFASHTQTVAVIGGSVTLRCFFYGYPEPTISWSGPRNTLPIGRYTLHSFNTELIISNVAASDEGDYTCTASNTHGRHTHTLQIRVEAVPRFLTVNDGPRNVNVTEGESVTFNCNADAKPEAQIVWFQDGNELDPNNPSGRFAFSNNKKSLTIRDVCRNCEDRDKQTDLMVIQCNASNVHGYAFAQGYLNVLSKTVVTIHNATEVTVNTNEDGQVQFDCRATSDPSTPPTIRWYKVVAGGDGLVYSDPPFVTVNGGLLSIHVAANPAENWPKYLGQYRCVADTGYSRVNLTVDIAARFVEEPVAEVRKPPTITKHPSARVIYRNDDSVTLECKAEGIPDVSYEWKRNGRELNQNQPNINKGPDGTITIQSATAMDEGFYQCLARNQYGTALSITAHIQRAILDSVSGTPRTLRKTVQEGMPFHIQADPRRSFPKPTYGWEMAADTVDKNPIPLRPSRRVQIAENGDLHFAYALPDDAFDGRLYKCTTYNPHLDVKAGGSYTKLTVTTNPAGVHSLAPTLGFSSERQTVAGIGGSVTLRCFFYGFPEPTITWSGPRNTLPIGRYRLMPFNTELTINNITASDEGGYTCTASNPRGSNTHILQIRVEEVPIFRSVKDGPYDVSVTEGESHTFNCNVNAKPEAKIVWLQGGVELDVNNPPRRFAFSNNKKSLTIRDVCRDCDDRDKQTDLTVIQCNASNIHGYAFAQGYLNVLTKTKVILVNGQDVRVGLFEEKEVKFECSATSDPSTPPNVRWHKVDENNEEQPVYDSPPTVTIRGGALTIYVNPNGAQKWTAYHGEYRCIGDNGYSKDTAAVKLIVEEPVLPGTKATTPMPPRPAVSLTTRVLAYLKLASNANNIFPQSGLRPSSGLIYESPPAVSRKYISALRLWIPAKFAGKYSVIVFDISKANNISDAMDISLREAEQSGPCVFLVDNMDKLYPKSSGNERQQKANVKRLLQATARTLRNTFVLFLGFVADLGNLNPALIKSDLFARD